MASSSNGDAMKPQFFTIILCPPLQLHQLRIPPAFIEEHGRTLLDHAFLETPEGEEHKVGLTIDDEAQFWFDDRWEEFAARFSLGLGSFLVFRYEGNSRFNVLIFDKSCSEIDYPEFNPTDEDNNPGEDEEIVDPLQRAQAFESDNPYFVVPMHESYLKDRYRMLVPSSYSTVYMASYKNNTGIRLELEGVPKGKTCQVNVLTKYVPRRKILKATLSAGWKSFAIENGLSVRDACVFELIDNEANAYRVHIFRGKQLSDTDDEDDDTDNNPGIIGPKERAKAFRSVNPYFLANICKSYFSSGFLWVPARHAKRYLLRARSNTLLLEPAEEHVMGDDGETWEVNFSSEKPRPGIVTAVKITTGWRDFVLDNDLQVGDACVFELTDRSSMTYRVHIFRGKKLSDTDEEDDDEDNTDDNQGIIRAKKSTRAFRSVNPHFLVNMHETYLSGDFRLWVPARHAKRYLLGARSNTLLLEPAEEHVVGDDGKTWEVNFSSEPARHTRVTVVRITTGWRAFALDNGLQVGDACVFELIDRSSMTYRVHIYRESSAAP